MAEKFSIFHIVKELSCLEIHYDDCKIGKKKEDSIDKVANATIASQI